MYNKATESEIFVRETSSIIMYLYKEVNNPIRFLSLLKGEAPCVIRQRKPFNEKHALSFHKNINFLILNSLSCLLCGSVRVSARNIRNSLKTE